MSPSVAKASFSILLFIFGWISLVLVPFDFAKGFFPFFVEIGSLFGVGAAQSMARGGYLHGLLLLACFAAFVFPVLLAVGRYLDPTPSVETPKRAEILLILFLPGWIAALTLPFPQGDYWVGARMEGRATSGLADDLSIPEEVMNEFEIADGLANVGSPEYRKIFRVARCPDWRDGCPDGYVQGRFQRHRETILEAHLLQARGGRESVVGRYSLLAVAMLFFLAILSLNHLQLRVNQMRRVLDAR